MKEIFVQYIAPIFGSITLASIFGAVVYGLIKGAVTKLITKINIEKIHKDTVEGGIAQVKNITFKHNIQPLVESGLEKVNEKSAEYVNKSLEKVYDKLDKIIKIQEKQAKYFDASIGVSDEAKAELKAAIEEAKEEKVAEVVSCVVDEPKVEEKVKVREKSKVER